MGKTSPDQITWWYVDLGAVHSVYSIRIQFRDYGQMYSKQELKIYCSRLNIHVIIIFKKYVILKYSFDHHTSINTLKKSSFEAKITKTL